VKERVRFNLTARLYDVYVGACSRTGPEAGGIVCSGMFPNYLSLLFKRRLEARAVGNPSVPGACFTFTSS